MELFNLIGVLFGLGLVCGWIYAGIKCIQDGEQLVGWMIIGSFVVGLLSL